MTPPSFISPYATQALQHEVAGAPDEYNQPTYAAAVTVMGRLEAGHKLVRDSTGTTVVSTAHVFSTEPVALGDRINGRPVVSVEPMAGLDGVPVFWEVYLV